MQFIRIYKKNSFTIIYEWKNLCYVGLWPESGRLVSIRSERLFVKTHVMARFVALAASFTFVPICAKRTNSSLIISSN